MSARTLVVFGLFLAMVPAAVHAELPGPVRAMIESAMRTDDPKAVAAVVKAAKETQPQDSAEIDAMKQKFDDTHNLISAERAERERERLLAARPLELWKGEGEIGAFRNTGNTNNVGFSAGLKLERIGVYWQHKLQLNTDYQKTNGDVSREQFLAAYSARYQLRDQFYVYGLVQYDRDRFQGFDNRYSISSGFGYRVLDSSDLRLSLEAGPALRYTDYIDEDSRTNASGLGSVDFSWTPAKTMKLTQVASAFLDPENSTFISQTAIEAGMVKGLRARLSYRVEHDTNPPDSARHTDTLSRFTLVYGF